MNCAPPATKPRYRRTAAPEKTFYKAATPLPTSLFTPSMVKPLKAITPLNMQANPMGFASVDLFHDAYDFEPYLVFTEFHMDKAIFGPHPHAGISVLTYMLPESRGSFLNRDSMGDHSIIEPGGVHVTQAGRGIHHDELPAKPGIDCHGFQIWINHSGKNRLVEPKAFHAAPAEVKEYHSDGISVRVLLGQWEQTVSPITLVTDAILFDVTLQPGASVSFDAKEMAFIYLMSGQLSIENRAIAGISMISFEKTGNSIQITGGETVARFMFASGTPHNEPVVHGGPFVMTTREQLQETRLRLMRGEMGVLSPL
jgi:redox-sensitive bicupin YhaK (pirin superfamily)